MAYSETKRKQSRSYSDEDDNAEMSPLEMVRIAMLKLNGLASGGDPQDISTMLQSLEEYLERATSARSRVSARLAYSAEKQRPAGDLFNDSTARGMDSAPQSPSALDRSSSRLQRSVFMENQLDLNESEMAYYEGVVNDLADRLEALTAEKEELQAVSAGLGDRLHRLSQQKDEALLRAQQELDAVRTQCQGMLNDLHAQLAASQEVSSRLLVHS